MNLATTSGAYTYFDHDRINDETSSTAEVYHSFNRDDIYTMGQTSEYSQSRMWNENIPSHAKSNDELYYDTSVLRKHSKPEYETEGYTPHAPIYINGDENFTEENGVTGGSGTINDPYIIEGWNITKAPAIRLKYTSSYFVIQNCLLSVQSGSGFAVIELRDFVCNGLVSHVIIDSTENDR
jgi:hypothetical protein